VGLSVVLGGGIIIFTIMYVIMTFPSIIDATSGVITTSSLKSEIENAILKSDIRISSVNGVALSNVVDIVLGNTGNEKLWDYNRFSVIITYDGGIISKTKYTEQLNYQELCTATAGKWCISEFLSDLQDPEIFNSDERLHIKANLAHPLYTNGRITALISTDNGVTTSRSVIVS